MTAVFFVSQPHPMGRWVYSIDDNKTPIFRALRQVAALINVKLRPLPRTPHAERTCVIVCPGWKAEGDRFPRSCEQLVSDVVEARCQYPIPNRFLYYHPGFQEDPGCKAKLRLLGARLITNVPEFWHFCLQDHPPLSQSELERVLEEALRKKSRHLLHEVKAFSRHRRNLTNDFRERVQACVEEAEQEGIIGKSDVQLGSINDIRNTLKEIKRRISYE